MMIALKGSAGSTRAESQLSAGATGIPGTATRLQVRRSHRIGLDQSSDDAVFVVEQGCITCDLALPSGLRHILLVLYPGDIFGRSFLGQLRGLSLTAAMPSNLTRVVLTRGSGEGEIQAVLARFVAGQARLLARTSLYATAMGRFSAEERLGTLLADLALHLGRPTPGGHVFEVPFSRKDMADHLALNPDSLSRLMTRFKARGIVTLPTRTRAIARDLDALLATPPLGSVLLEMSTPVTQSE